GGFAWPDGTSECAGCRAGTDGAGTDAGIDVDISASSRGRAMIAGRANVVALLLVMKARMRSRVSVVMRPPLRSRVVSLPSLTARRPKVDSASPLWRQYSEISCSSSCALIDDAPMKCFRTLAPAALLA